MLACLTALFLAQPAPPPAEATPSPDALLRQADATPELAGAPKPFEIAASLGSLYLGQGRYADALRYYEQATAVAGPTRTLLLQRRKAQGTQAAAPAEAAGCAAGVKVAEAEVHARAHLKAGKGALALACLEAVAPVIARAETTLGNVRFLLRDVPGARAAYDAALETSPDLALARYGRAALRLDTDGDDVAALREVKQDLGRFLEVSPAAPQAAQAKRLLALTDEALAAGGLSKVKPPAQAPAPVTPPALSDEMVAAFQNAPRTEAMADNFKQLMDDAEARMAKGEYAEALADYRQVMPYEPDNPRVRAGIAWTMVKLDRQPMADNVWGVAIQTPDAVAELGDRLKAKGDADGARALWQRLKDTAPAYAPKLEGRL